MDLDVKSFGLRSRRGFLSHGFELSVASANTGSEALSSAYAIAMALSTPYRPSRALAKMGYWEGLPCWRR